MVPCELCVVLCRATMSNVGILQTFGQSTKVWTDMQQSAFQQFEQESLKNKLKSH